MARDQPLYRYHTLAGQVRNLEDGPWSTSLDSQTIERKCIDIPTTTYSQMTGRILSANAISDTDTISGGRTQQPCIEGSSCLRVADICIQDLKGARWSVHFGSPIK